MVLAAMCLAAVACGHRGDPRPPIYPAPPPITRITVSQVGTQAVLRFPLPPTTIEAGNDTIEVSTIEVLVFTERYPVLDIEMLATALERHRNLIIEDAVAAAAAAEEADRLDAIRAQYEDPQEAAEAVAAAQAAAAEAAGEDEAEEPRDEDERLVYHISPSVRTEWRNEGVTPEVILDSARNLEAVVTSIWTELGLPTTVLDPTMPMSLPDTAELTELAETLLEEISYEREVPVEVFVTRAGSPAQLSFEEAEEAMVDDLVELAQPVGIPAPDEFRTRYFFSARARSARNVAGEVRTVRALAPSPVPLPPTGVTVELGYELRPIPVPLILPILTPGVDETQPPGINVSWDPPPGDVWGRLLMTPSLVYNVYRTRLVADDPEAADGMREESSSVPLNARPLATTTYIDRSMDWGERYVYEVRAMVEPPLGAGRRESGGARSTLIEAIDTFPPAAPTDLQIVRAGSQLRLQWSLTTDPDLLGYRIYRHALPAPATIDATWDEITPEPVAASRFLDSATESGVSYAYAVVSVDQMGNTSEPLIAEEPGAIQE
jgi:hypothetical protein